MRTGLFFGIETWGWSLADFDQAIADTKRLGFDYMVLKVYEITQGDWYQKLGGSKVVVEHIKGQGMGVLPFGYFYGLMAQIECDDILRYLGDHGKFCLDMEGEFDGNTRAAPFVNRLKGHTGDLYISTWANIVDHQWLENVRQLDPLVKGWLPQVYYSYDAQVYKHQWLAALPTLLKVHPTFNAASGGTNDPTTWASQSGEFTIWEYQQLKGKP